MECLIYYTLSEKERIELEMLIEKEINIVQELLKEDEINKRSHLVKKAIEEKNHLLNVLMMKFSKKRKKVYKRG